MEQSLTVAPKWQPHKKEIAWVVGTMVFIIGVLILAPILVRSLTTFDHRGLSFTQEKFGNIPVYHYSYYFIDSLGQQYQYNLYLRHDPRKNTVPIENSVRFKERTNAYITLNSTALSACPTSLRDVATLAQFLSDNLIKAQAGNMDRVLALENNLTYVTCDTHPRDVVIAILPGNETRITQQGFCHQITYASCEEVLPALEKFMVEAVIDAK